MDPTCSRLKLLMVVLLLHSDVELNVFTAATPSWQCKSAYCRNKQTPSSHEVQFTDKPRPATLAIGCLGRQTDLICCTANYAHISWQFLADDTTWRDFWSIDPDNRCLSEVNQTASIVDFQHKDVGRYRCVAYGHNGDVISNEVKLKAEDCSDYHGPPVRTSPNQTEFEVSTGQSADVPCVGFFANLTWCGSDSFDCDIGWVRHPFNWSDVDFVPITNDTSQRIYTETSPVGGNQLRSILHIKNVTDDDYRGSFECWMVREAKYANTTLIRFKAERRVVVEGDDADRTVAIVCASVVAFFAVLLVVLFPFRHNIKLAVKQRLRTPPSDEGLDYDVLLLHADSDSTNEFGALLRSKLTELSKPPYEVFHYSGDDLLPGRGIFPAMEHSLRSSRCAVVVLCPTFVAKYSESWFLLANLITEIDIIYVLFDGLDAATLTQQPHLNNAATTAITSSMRNSRCLTWSWSVNDDAKQALRDKLNTALFWCHLKLAIPNRRRRSISAKPAATAGQNTPDSVSDSDASRRLLPTTACPSASYTC